MATSSAHRCASRSAPRVFGWPGEPVAVGWSARVWWLAAGCWFTGSAVGQLFHSPAAMRLPNPVSLHIDHPTLPAPMAVVLFGMVATLWASVVLPMRDGAGWARRVLTVAAVPGALAMLRQGVSALVTGPPMLGGMVQAGLTAVALCAITAAVGLMYQREARAYFRSIPT